MKKVHRQFEALNRARDGRLPDTAKQLAQELRERIESWDQSSAFQRLATMSLASRVEQVSTETI